MKKIIIFLMFTLSIFSQTKTEYYKIQDMETKIKKMESQGWDTISISYPPNYLSEVTVTYERTKTVTTTVSCNFDQIQSLITKHTQQGWTYIETIVSAESVNVNRTNDNIESKYIIVFKKTI